MPCRKIKTNYFIVSLAFADLLVSVLVMPFGAIELVQDNWIYGEMFCLVRTSLDVLLTTASILHLCCISLDRYELQSGTAGRLCWVLGCPELLEGKDGPAGDGRAMHLSQWLILERTLMRAEKLGMG